MTRTIGLSVIAGVVIVGGFAGLAWRQAHPPLPGPLPLVACRVTIADPASGLAAVRLELEKDALRHRRQLILAFADDRGTHRRLRSFAVQVNGSDVAPVMRVVRGVPVYLVPIASGARSLTISYTIEPTYFPPGSRLDDPADARSRIAADLAVVRSSSLFPRIDVPGGGAALGVEFELPRGWVAASPWHSEEGRVIVPADPGAPLEYLALGPFETRLLTIGAAEVQLATPALLATRELPIEAIVAREMELLAAPFKRPGSFLITLVPDAFMHGGAAGERTIVQSSSPEVLAHEVFHWWNDGALTTRDAAWFREGLTEYYGIRVAREAGAWTAEEELACFADLDAEMRRLEQARPIGLEEASTDPGATRLVYAKGALFWMLVDQRLRASGRYLEEAVRRVVTSPREELTTADLRSLFSGLYGGAVDAEFDRYVLGANRLPDLALPPATGRTGCARD